MFAFVNNAALMEDAASSAHGRLLTEMRMETGLLRPFIEDSPNSPYRGRPCVNIWSGKYRDDGTPIYKTYLQEHLRARGINSPVFNATYLRKGEWIEFDKKALEAFRLRPQAWDDLEKSASYGGFNGLGKTLLEHETVSDVGEAVVDMDGINQGRNDAPQFQLEGLPLPITHVDFFINLRKLTASRNSGMPLDTRIAANGGVRVRESLEKVTIGVDTGITYGGNSTQTGGYGRTSSVYGYMNHPARITKTNLYKPTGVGRAGTGWVPLDTLKDVLAMRQSMLNNKLFGPYMIYHSNDWDEYLDGDYKLVSTSDSAPQTLRQRLMSIGNAGDILGVKRLDFLASSATTYANDIARILSANPWTMIMVQLGDERVARAVNGQDLTTTQYEEKGGWKICFKLWCIKVPQIRADFGGICGVLHANASAGV